MSLHAEAEAGRLTAHKLRQFGVNRKDEIDPSSGLTPLIIAVRRGHITVIKALATCGADLNKPSEDGRTPLYWATYDKKYPNRVGVVRELLSYQDIEVNETSPDVKNITPLMNAITRLKDPEVVSLLVDAKASLTTTNDKGETATQLAEKSLDPKMSRALLPAEERNAPSPETISRIVETVTFVISWFNNPRGTIGSLLQGAVQALLGPTDAGDKEAQKELHEAIGGPQSSDMPKTEEEFQDKLEDWVVNNKLAQFFKPGDPFLPRLAQNAMKLLKNPNDPLSSHTNVNKLVKLAFYKSILYCDDSSSMEDVDRDMHDSRAVRQTRLVQRITKITARIVPEEGVDLYYINANGLRNANARDIQTKMINTKPKGGTPIGTRLKEKILNPLVYEVLRHNLEFKRPLLISIITDGEPSQEDKTVFEKEVLHCVQELERLQYPAHSVVFQISRIGNNPKAKDFLKELAKRSEKCKSLYCTGVQLDQKLDDNERELEQWLLDIITKPIERALPVSNILPDL